MLSAQHFWVVIDALAAERGMSASGLARAAGLDATTFNPSKRTDPNGRVRWPATSTLVSLLDVTGLSLVDLARRVEQAARRDGGTKPGTRARRRPAPDIARAAAER